MKRNAHLGLEINMLYTFGDSMSFGWNLYQTMSEEDRIALAWPGLLSKKLNQPLKDYSFPGASNWKAARVLQSLPLTPDDTVVIQWSAWDRFEFGVSQHYRYESSMAEDNKYKIVDSVQYDDGIATKNMCRTLIPHTTDRDAKKFMFYAYNTFNNPAWHLEMFKVMMTSCLYVLNKAGCKYIMFDGWCKHCRDDLFTDVPQYILRDTTMNNVTKNLSGVTEQDLGYGGPEQNQIIADTVYEHLEQIYGH